MSTQSTAIPSSPVSPIKSEPGVAELCTSLLPSGPAGGILTKYFHEQKLSISVRPVSVADDVPILYKWMSHEYAGPLLDRPQHPREMEEFYNSMIESDFAQPFMGLVNDTPVCQMDVYKAKQDAISLYYEARPGDYGLQLVVAPMTAQENMVLLLRTCLEYFFSFHEVGRVVTDVEVKNEWSNHLFKAVGFQHTQEIRIPHKNANLYICTRESFRQANGS